MQSESVAFEKQATEASDTNKSVVLVRAMVAAAKADGHVDDAEKKAMLRLVDQQQFDTETLEFLKTQISAEMTVEEIAALAETPELANEMYLACRIVIDTSNSLEQQWLTELAAALNLSEELVTSLEAQIA